MAPNALSIVVADVGVSFGGAIVSGATLCRALADLGHRATLVTALAVEDVAHLTTPAVAVRSLKHTVDYRQWEALIQRRETRYPPAFRRLMEYPEVAWHLILRNVPYALQLSSICREVGATVLHANNGPDLPTAMAARLARRPMVMHLRGVHASSRIVDVAVGTARRCIAISQHTLDGCAAAGVPREKLQLLHNPVEAERPEPARIQQTRHELGAGPGDFLVGAVGRIVEWKGQLELVQALTPLLHTAPEMKLVIVGDEADGTGRYLAAIRQWVAAHRLEAQVRFAGFRKDIDVVYAALDVMAHTSIAPEPFGRVIVEAMLQECAVVASPMGGPLEIITDGVDGMLLDSRDPTSLREGIDRLRQDPALRARLARAGAEMARTRFGARRYAERMTEVYRAVAST